ncbi:hypothetical protein SKAU_G00179140 [Synaphobranchus kaupii]|uniref:Uncharacterized protein n=1 Tax=Synaphobranchus kaupii TaxID=118154 RepID=A0A9Q1FML1_SYNKA|nr:hypothetical protein SKAU_G00179140 [Synaphobranchus kaupii]
MKWEGLAGWTLTNQTSLFNGREGGGGGGVQTHFASPSSTSLSLFGVFHRLTEARQSQVLLLSDARVGTNRPLRSLLCSVRILKSFLCNKAMCCVLNIYIFF